MYSLTCAELQVDFTFGCVGGGRGGRELCGDAEGHFFQWAVRAGLGDAATAGIGTAGWGQARPLLVATLPGAAVGQATKAPSLLVRHEGGEFGRVPGLAHGGGVAGHPAGV